MPTIATHTSPDWDAITSCWLLQRFGGLETAEVVFVNTGRPDPRVIDQAKAVVDTGRIYDPADLRFDHHQMRPGDRHNTCAAEQVAMHLLELGKVDLSIWPIVNLVWAGDIGAARDGADWSRQVGIHAVLSGWKRQGHSDEWLLMHGYVILDALAADLRGKAEGRRKLDACTVWKSDDGLVWALEGGGHGAGNAAAELGARLVVYVDSHTRGGRTYYAAGCWRYGGYEVQEPHVGKLVERLADTPASTSLSCELEGWFCHPAGFYAGAGGDKAPRTDPPSVGAAEIAQAISAMWER